MNAVTRLIDRVEKEGSPFVASLLEVDGDKAAKEILDIFSKYNSADVIIGLCVATGIFLSKCQDGGDPEITTNDRLRLIATISRVVAHDTASARKDINGRPT